MANAGKKDFGPLAKFINGAYLGELTDLSRYLDHALYMLHYLPDGEFSKREIQNVVFALWNIREALHAASAKKKGKNFVSLSF